MSEKELLKKIRLLELEVQHWVNRESALTQWLAARLIAANPSCMGELIQILASYNENHSDDLFNLTFLRNLQEDLAVIRPDLDISVLHEEIRRIEHRIFSQFY